ncbi:MAG: cob(I)yrinic acid a,c-diamide adenosyltransferase [Candidatus Odinarchaeia archaeon]
MRNGGGRILTFIGDGDGKTTAALGHAMRAAGHGRKVIVMHFLKGRRNIGEYKFLMNGVKGIDVYLCGTSRFLITEEDYKEHLKLVKKCFDLAKKIVAENRCDMLVLDEILYAVKYGLISENELLELLRMKKDMHIILTGREASEEIKAMSDVVTFMEEIKHHYHHDRVTIEGLDY